MSGTLVAPLSAQQEGVWFDALLDPDDVRFNVSTVVPYRGPLDAATVRGALEAIAARHSVLRSTFEPAPDAPRQEVRPSPSVELRVLDLAREPEPARQALQREALMEVRRRPFRLGPDTWRAALLHLDEDRHLVAVTAHHLVSDDLSMDIWARELTALCRDGRAARLPELPIQYADYAAWQRRWLQEPEVVELVRARAGRLAGAPARAPAAGPAAGDPAGHRFLVPARLVRRLRELALRERASMFAACLAVHAAVLRDRLDRTDVVVGAILPGRARAEVTGLIGCFANILVLRLAVEQGASLADLVRLARREAIDAWSHQEVPFGRVVEVLRPSRRPGVMPVTGLGFQFVEGRAAGSAPEGPDAVSASPFDVELILGALEDGGATGTVVARAGHAGWARPLAERYVELLEAGLADPLRPLRRPRGTAASPAAGTGPAAPGGGPVDELIRARAAGRPDQPAVRCDGRELRYAELLGQADALAARLQAAGAGRGAVVGVLLARSERLVVALLGTLAAGAVYVPLDPSYPEERLRLMAARARLAAVVADRPLPEGLAALAPHVVEPDGSAGPRPRPVPRSDGDVAYVMFTSGSTGQPKGVMVEHRALSSALEAIGCEVGSAPGERFLATTSISFDISLLELLLPLASGGTVVVAGDRAYRDPDELLGLAEAERVAVVQGTPAAWRMLLEARPGRALPFRALCGGDTLHPDLAAELGRRAPAAWNLYGPTEATIWASAARLAGADAPVTIGRPLANAVYEVVDDDLRPTAPGEAGELLIGGAGLARGYLDDPGLTAARFVPGPGGARWYRTGDRVGRRPDAAYEHLGRMDGQVKVRGHRIELVEVERALHDHPAVREAAVAAEPEPSGERALVAYVRVDARDVSAAGLRAHLARRLPDFMLPAAYLAVERLPLTGSGKVDRRALHRGLGAPLAGAGGAPPAGPVERRMLQLCAELLGTDVVGLDDDLFLIGGHSLTLVQLVGRARRAFGVALPLREAYERPTARGLAALIEELQRGSAVETAPPLVRLPRDA